MKKKIPIALIVLFTVLLSVLLVIPASAGVGYYMNCTIYYKTENGTLLGTETGMADAANNPTFTRESPTFEGYVLKNPSDAVVTYEMMEKHFPASNYVRQGGASYTVIYVPAYTVTVNFLYRDGRRAASPQSYTGKQGDSYRIDPPQIPHYRPHVTFVMGVVSDRDESVNVFYDELTYTIRFNTNGGEGVFPAEKKYDGMTHYLSYGKPTRSGYEFLGWALNAGAGTAVYQPGGAFDREADTTLYAVWREIRYDLGVTRITVSPTEIYQYDTVSVEIRLDNWDRYHAYPAVPVETFLDGVQIDSRTVDFDAYGIVWVRFSAEIGSRIGDRILTVRVNRQDCLNEVDTSNNESSVTFRVSKLIRAAIAHIAPNAPYTAGTEVITSFYVTNYSTGDLIPAAGVSFRFTVIDAEGNTVTDQEKTGVVIPARSSNLIWFRWTVPENAAETELVIDGTLIGDFPDSSESDLTDLFAVIPVAKTVSHTPDTSFESAAPATYPPEIAVPSATPGRATWAEWVYDEGSGSLILMEYGIAVSAPNPAVTPDASCPSAFLRDGTWVMKSGYGINLSWQFSYGAAAGYDLPDADAYTVAQSVYATLPEYGYSLRAGQYETLTEQSGEWSFTGGVHDLPVWLRDEPYTVVATAADLWTPAGMLLARRQANTVRIEGSVYDDWTRT